MPRVGWLVTGSPTSHRFSLAAFKDGLKSLGYEEGQNIGIEYRWAEGNLARLPELANDLVQQKVDVILAGGTPVVEAVRHATSTIPIVGAGVGDLAELGLVASLARPGGNLTGFIAIAPEPEAPANVRRRSRAENGFKSSAAPAHYAACSFATNQQSPARVGAEAI